MGRVRVSALQTRGARISIFVLGCGLLAALAACGGGSGPTAAPADAPGGAIANLPPPSTLRAVSYDPEQLVLGGGDYVDQAGYPLQNVSGSGEFTPGWTAEAPDPAGLAFACYSFELSDYDREQVIAFSWDAVGDPADLYIALADFANDRWSWHSLAGENTLALDFAPYISPDTSKMLIVPLATGTTPWQLNRIQVGDLTTVSGYVFEDDGTTPIEGAALTLDGDQDYAAETGADGKWSVTGMLPGDYEATIELFGWSFEPASQQLSVDGLAFAADDFIGTPLPRYEVRGYIQTSTGTPLAGVTVAVVPDESPGDAFIGQTDDVGFWAVDAPDGDYTATPSKPAWYFLPETRALTVAGGEVIVQPFVANQLPGYPVEGFVFQSDGSTPLADVLVSVSHTELDLVYEATTDAEGQWSVPEVIDGDYIVEPALYGWQFTPGTLPITVDGSEVTVDPFLGEERSRHNLQGYVYLQDGSTQLPDTDIELDYGTGTFSTATDATGRYEFIDIYAGSYVITPAKLGYGFDPAEQTVEVAGNTTADPFLATQLPGHKISGYIFKVDGITGIDGVQVTVDSISPPGASFQAVTNLSGYWQVLDAPDASYLAVPQKPGYFFEPTEQIVLVEGADVTAEDFVGTPLPTHSISGFTFTQDGFTALPGVTVFVEGTWFSYEVVTDETGHWQIDGVLEDDYHVWPMLAPWQFSPDSRNVTVEGGDLIVAPFMGEELQAYAVDGFIYQILTTIPIIGVDVWFHSDTLNYRATTAGNGQYQTLLPIGEWEATPVSADWTFDPLMQAFSMTGDPLTLEVFFGIP
jgi:hypothetical protein